MATAGRKTKRTQAVAEAILSSLRSGASQRAACEAAGISVDTFAAWRVENPDFAREVEKAEGLAVRAVEDTLFVAAQADWRASESWLSRRRRIDWTNKVNTAPADADGLSDDEDDDEPAEVLIEHVEAWLHLLKADRDSPVGLVGVG